MNHVDELISASLTGDLTDTERHQLETHLDSCPRCRATLAAFTDQRRLVSGLRHVQPPRDLGARVRVGLESGRRLDVPWWRRPAGILAALGGVGAVAAGAVLALVLFNPSTPPEVASSVEPFVTSTASPSQIPAESLTPTPTETPAPTPIPSASVVPDELAKPSGYFVYQVLNQSGSIVFSGQKEIALKVPSLGMPVRASLSPDGAWVAFRIDGDLSGMSDFYALRLSDGVVFPLGKSLQPAYGLGEQLSWSPDSKSVIYTLTTPESRIDAWLFTTDDQQTRQMTNTGDAYAASWTANGDLWLSRAAEQPSSYLISTHGEGLTMPFDPASVAAATVQGAFAPLVSPDGSHVIFWRGTMGTPGGHWSFSEGAMPWLADVSDNGEVDFDNARQVFSTLAGGREMFRGASIAWGPDSDAFAVWNAQWTGVPQGDRFPDSTRVYFGHVSKPELITAGQTLDEPDTKDATAIVDVAIAADGDHLALTVVTAEGAEGGSFGPTAQLRLVTRGYGTDPDKVQIIGEDKVWYGPAVYPPAAQ
jgi:hypothetical protein